MNLFDARLNKKYCNFRETWCNDNVEFNVYLQDLSKDVTFYSSYEGHDTTKSSILKLLEISGYTVIQL